MLVLAGLAAVGLWALYRMRRWQTVAGLSARLEDRIAERNRLASELQDTFLQSVQASRLLADQARFDQSIDPATLRQTVETLSEWLGKAISEGQNALNALRSSGNLRNNLAEAFQQAAALSQLTNAKEFVLSVEGAAKELHPIVRDEVYRVGSEAIRKAYLNPDGHRVELLIVYSRDLLVRIREMGGSPHRYNDLTELKKTARRVGGRVHLRRRPDSSTEIVLRVPGLAAYYGLNRLNESLEKSDV
jgi:signal transduction histidine kinase